MSKYILEFSLKTKAGTFRRKETIEADVQSQAIEIIKAKYGDSILYGRVGFVGIEKDPIPSSIPPSPTIKDAVAATCPDASNGPSVSVEKSSKGDQSNYDLEQRNRGFNAAITKLAQGKRISNVDRKALLYRRSWIEDWTCGFSSDMLDIIALGYLEGQVRELEGVAPDRSVNYIKGLVRKLKRRTASRERNAKQLALLGNVCLPGVWVGLAALYYLGPNHGYLMPGVATALCAIAGVAWGKRVDGCGWLLLVFLISIGANWFYPIPHINDAYRFLMLPSKDPHIEEAQSKPDLANEPVSNGQMRGHSAAATGHSDRSGDLVHRGGFPIEGRWEMLIGKKRVIWNFRRDFTVVSSSGHSGKWSLTEKGVRVDLGKGTVDLQGPFDDGKATGASNNGDNVVATRLKDSR